MRPSFINLARLAGARYRLHKDMYMAASGNAMAGGAAGGAGGAAGAYGDLKQYGQNFDQGLWGLFHSLFNNNQDPYKQGFQASQPYFKSATDYQNPFAKQGQESSGKFNNWLDTMKNPSEFINKLMGGYQESPWAQNLQRQSVRAGTNAASASGLTGSTPFAQQLQQNANNISSEDMTKWLSNVLGINTEYGQGENMSAERGSHASDILSQLFAKQGYMAAGAEYGTNAWKNQNEDSAWSNIAKMFGG